MIPTPQGVRSDAGRPPRSSAKILLAPIFSTVWTTSAVLLSAGVLSIASLAEADGVKTHPPVGDDLPLVRTKRFAIHYDVADSSGPLQAVGLWYTQDEGETWHNYGNDPDRVSPFDFIAPGEGLYGFCLILKSAGGVSADPPSSGTKPQLWAFVDYTPPILQLHFARFEKDNPSTRRIQIRWTAFDQFPLKRPITIRFKREKDTSWYPVAGPMPNVGGYDWPVLDKLRGNVSIKVTFLDRGGNITERKVAPLYIPPSVPDPVPTSRPASSSLPFPAARLNKPDPYKAAASQPTLAQIQKAQELFKLGGYHRLRGEFDLAGERFKEVLELDPRNIEARIELGGIQLLEKNYEGAIGWYQSLLKDHPQNRDARYGMALAYWHKRQYAASRDQLDRILSVDASDASARLKLGDAYWQLGNENRARQQWRMVKEDEHAEADLIKKAEARLRNFLVAGNRR